MHSAVINATSDLMNEWIAVCNTDNNLNGLLSPNKGALNSRRRAQQKKIKELSAYKDYEASCEAVLL